MTKSELMQKVQATIDRRGEEIIALGEAIRRQPELGFKEFKTAKLVAQTFERMGLTPRTGLALTGVRADVAGRAGDGPTLALFG
ncbi:MAG TPA: amidohydrolase, partial [Methylomirabilota bacterium]|nr:amidohydrolase [Methylomirabilota bacterium]